MPHDRLERLRTSVTDVQEESRSVIDLLGGQCACEPHVASCWRASGRDDHAVATGRGTIEAALRPALSERGWTPRASGWFTHPVLPGVLGVVALGVASKHSAPGAATATIHVHIRDERLEAAVADVTGWADQGYKTTTATTSIGYLMPSGRWYEWDVRPDSVDLVANEMALAVKQYAEPHVRKLAVDPDALLVAITASASYSTAHGLVRAVLMLSRTGRRREAGDLLAARMAQLGDRSDAAATEERHVGTTLSEHLNS